MNDNSTTAGTPRRVVARRQPTAETKAAPLRPLNAPPLERARDHLRHARRTRAEYLIAVTEGTVTPLDLFTFAATDEGRPLRRLPLRQVLLAQPGWGQVQTKTFLSVLSAKIGPNEDASDKTVAWLIDPRSGGRRFLAWLDNEQPKQIRAGFPFAAVEEVA